MNTIVNTMGTNFWFFLGLTDRAAESQWVWSSDGSTVAWTLWKSGEPDGGRNQDCAAHIVRHGASWNKKWGSMYCYQYYAIPVVCEKTRKYKIYHLTKEIYE